MARGGAKKREPAQKQLISFPQMERKHIGHIGIVAVRAECFAGESAQTAFSVNGPLYL
jgi:hypothetical protein